MKTLPDALPPSVWTESALPNEAHATAALATAADTVVHSSELLRGQRTIAIAHNGSVYRLQATRQGKLILTK